MDTGRASATAAQNGLFRAVESLRPPTTRLFHDPLATELLPTRYRLVAGAARVGWLRDRITQFIDARWPGVRSSVVARTRLIDDTIAAIAPEAAQLVILGAGLDTRALRLEALDDLPVFEVDHPATQSAKRRALSPHPRAADLAFVAHDFATGHPDTALREAGYDPAQPTVILWEGVTNYLTADDVDGTIRWCGRAAPGSHLIFTYIDSQVLRSPSDYVGAERALDSARRAGEPVTFGFRPEALPDYLHQRGLELLSDLSAADYRARCYGPPAATMRGHEYYHVAHARVPPVRETLRDRTGPPP